MKSTVSKFVTYVMIVGFFLQAVTPVLGSLNDLESRWQEILARVAQFRLRTVKRLVSPAACNERIDQRLPSTERLQQMTSKQMTTKGSSRDMRWYECQTCGYLYDPADGDSGSGVARGTSFRDLPDHWVCPICEVGRDAFKALDD